MKETILYLSIIVICIVVIWNACDICKLKYQIRMIVNDGEVK